MYFSVLVKWGGVCWGLGGMWVIGVFFFWGSKVLLKLSTFCRLKSKSKNSKNPFSPPVIFSKKKVAKFFYWKNFRFFHFNTF